MASQRNANGLTIDEWLADMPGTEGERARRCRDHGFSKGEFFGGRFNTLSVALRYAFDWDKTKHGSRYWARIATQYNNVRVNP